MMRQKINALDYQQSDQSQQPPLCKKFHFTLTPHSHCADSHGQHHHFTNLRGVRRLHSRCETVTQPVIWLHLIYRGERFSRDRISHPLGVDQCEPNCTVRFSVATRTAQTCEMILSAQCECSLRDTINSIILALCSNE